VVQAGVPIVTMSGRTLVSRMGGGILNSLGLSELTTDSYENYVLRCKQLSQDEAFRKKVREKMFQSHGLGFPTEGGLFNSNLIKSMSQGA
jgi:predicted O-linked N-acetylglucosamine transferase (SPINDLY family)